MVKPYMSLSSKYKCGDRVGSMTLMELASKVSYGANVWKVKCDCGKESHKKTSDFWKLKSCSYTCPLHLTRERKYPTGSRKEQLAWHDMKARCLDSAHPSYSNYGGRGISIHPLWVEDFNAFFAHVGPAPAGRVSLDRVDNDRGYEPSNVRWATHVQQANNKRDTVFLTVNGQTKSISDWARQLGCKHSKLYWRYQHGWSHEDIVNKP